ncbi:DEAD/DEAH box helicase [Clostridium taeniosporum]|uniref:ATP-dependent RNA helicase CshA n=1 Tax=Clostridium taeniosporum TaxID=394958 RepID=A0A1D7XPS3_9CLOT|nr:DEAD/DEAH box helicase [Clostridium taeniosporum]AOR25169.1 DEAD/DEAH box helicase [Clostridium taeniosporum]
MLFKDLKIIEPIQKALTEAGYTNPTPIQEQSIPSLLKGKDFLGCAQTGTGKTAAFAIPVLQNIAKNKKKSDESRTIQALILAPTRELAIQIEENFNLYSKHTNIKNTVIFGGVSQKPQTKILREGVDILIATPGRLLDLINQKYIDLSNVKHFVLDEADRMFDMGMVRDVKKIVAKLPKVRQNLLFSATMPSEVKNLVNSILKDPIRVEVAPVSSTIDTITQGVYFVKKKDKKSLLVHLLKDESIKSLLVFSRTKYGANNIVKDLVKTGTESQAIHGNKSQNARQLALSNFKEGKIRVLVATDIAARGIDVDGLSHVINYDLPDVPETYVHRIGRTGRAGHSGVALSFCDIEERNALKDIEKVIGKNIPVMDNVEFEKIVITREPAQKKEADKKGTGSRKPRRNWYANKKRKNGNGSQQGKKQSGRIQQAK